MPDTYKQNSFQDKKVMEELLTKAEELIKDKKLEEAQAILNGITERNAQWHYLQSLIFYRKKWYSESKKHIEDALVTEPDNEKYFKFYNKLKKRAKDASLSGANSKDKQMGKCKFSIKDDCKDICLACCEGICSS